MKNEFMSRAITLSIESVYKGGGPFGSLIVKDNKIISEGFNQVTSTNDPTAHGEIVAIRNSCKILNSFSLKGCDLYSSCEPCPMCLAAIWWARLESIYYANTREDAARIGFDDAEIYREVGRNLAERQIPMIRCESRVAALAFEEWATKEDKIPY